MFSDYMLTIKKTNAHMCVIGSGNEDDYDIYKIRLIYIGKSIYTCLFTRIVRFSEQSRIYASLGVNSYSYASFDTQKKLLLIFGAVLFILVCHSNNDPK